MPENIAMPNPCEHAWEYNKPAHASASVRICSLCHKIDGEELMRALDEYALEQMTKLKQRATTLLYAWSDGETFSYVDQPGGIPNSGRERALLRGLLTHALRSLDEEEHPLRLVSAPAFHSD
ncbi:hypothetical protein GCM10010348_76790 [Streptomyces anthocyanicus]|uniref:hypothetical protein n=1 Tax=Streptomyces anthocyanicus TaxID=68174 RepID=UPI0018774670|nr:hypothetical protein [Streptomyces anthocyanicus]WTC12555.1 hypothetical protein OHA15_33955 [Streptomyces anthocyanicus]GHC38130.1 hypothetical protein GCM10010348_76790 [Streptomyces anthocyanicus]